MDIAAHTKEKGPMLLAVTTMIILSAVMLFSVRQTLERQRKAVDQHMLLTARAVLKSVEISLLRGMGMRGRHAMPEARAYIRQLEQSGDVLFVGVFNDRGGRLLSGGPELKHFTVHLPSEALTEMVFRGFWQGRLPYGDTTTFVFGRPMVPRLSGLLRPGRMPGVPSQEPPKFLVVGLNINDHMAAYQEFRRQVIIQAVVLVGALLLFWLLVFSIHKRRAMARRTASLEQFQSKLLDNLPDGLLTVNAKGLIEAANPAAYSILQTEKGDLAGKSCAGLPAPIVDCLADGNRVWKHYEFAGRDLEVLTVPFSQHESEDKRLVLIRDRTEMKQLEENLAEAEKLAAVGVLAAGVAHEIRNPLSALRGFAQFFAKKFSKGTKEETYARTMVGEADRLNRVVTDLLYLASPKPIAPEEVSLLDITDEVRRLLSLDMESNEVKVHTDLSIDTVIADRDTLKQAVLNLMLNSLEALKESDPEEKTIILRSTAENGGWIFEVIDNGPGMTKEQRERAFEPFYTDKKQGTGLGLAIVHKTMRDHGGFARILPAESGGTVIELHFPEPGPDALSENTKDTQ